MLEQLSPQHFEPYLHQTFTIVYDDNQTLAVELIEVSELGRNRHGRDEATSQIPAFSLVFRAPVLDWYLKQAIYLLQHEQFGEVSLFLVPIGPDGVGMRYEAIFT